MAIISTNSQTKAELAVIPSCSGVNLKKEKKKKDKKKNKTKTKTKQVSLSCVHWKYSIFCLSVMQLDSILLIIK